MPVIAVTAAYARQVGPGTLGAPLERPVVDEFTGDRVMAITLGLGAERTDHLRMAVVATFTGVNIAAGQAQR
ncbi:hypothetical protein D3C81_2267370 [compost metagenome]